MHAPTKRSFSLAFLLGLSLTAGPAVAGQGNPGAGDHETGVTAREAPASGEPLPDQVGRELARLDERLDLGTFPDGSPLWPARLAASIERMTGAGAQAVPGRELLVSLATDLRALGVDQPLIGPPQAEPPAEDGPAAQRRSARLRHLLATARLLNRKLNRASSAADHVATRSSPANDDCASATSIGSGTFTGNTSGATNDGSATCGSSSSSPDVWYRYTATADGPVTFDTYGSTYDTVLSLRSACPGSGTELACSDDAGGTVQSAVTLDMTTGEEVWVRVSGFGGDAGSYVLHVAETGGISGTVTRQDTAAALSGVTVGVYDPNGFYVTEAQTSMDGTYKVDGLVPGTYYAEASVDNFVDEIYDGVPCPSYAYCYPGYNGTPLSVSSVVTGDIDFAVAPGASISGSLVDQGTGDPLQGFVYLYGATGGGYLTSVTTDGNGDYELTGLLPGKYYVKAQASGHQTEIYDDLPCPSSCDVTAGTQLQVTIGASVSGIDFALERLGNLEGTVSDQQTSAPVHSLRLYLYDSQGSFRSYTYSGSDGTYEFEGLLPGTYFLSTGSQYSDKAYLDELYDDLACATGCTVTTGTPISVPLAGTTSGIDFSLVRRGRISGAVTEAGIRGAPRKHTGRLLRRQRLPGGL